eukprot:gnl/TRDRNA2_/TRDRNA2_38466_c0_seq2.p1 gnl/TRDRNA2_/TRDRNA2_38466_c0~~gnl/TRDRNA2_/TRDRNA2_38466_c0_seq2.p1  ORF type:complete len:371 (+),score=70.48 gnl/TRDRNA2_/TRDRNA2_38466_c0_seq2:77-1189(+)
MKALNLGALLLLVEGLPGLLASSLHASRESYAVKRKFQSAEEVWKTKRFGFERSQRKRSANLKEDEEELPNLKVLTFSDSLKPELTYLLSSAAAVGMEPTTLGLGRVNGVSWGQGLGGPKIKAVQEYVKRPKLKDDDLLLFADAYDVLVVGGEKEIVKKYLKMEKETGKSIIFTAERHCFPVQVCADPDIGEYPPAPTQWRYLNSGMFIGRVGAIRKMLTTHAMPELDGISLYENHDQAWYQRYYLKYDDVALDHECDLFCSTPGIDAVEDSFTVHGRRFVNLETGAEPAIVHFPGPGHWSRPKGKHISMWLYEGFKSCFPELSERLFGRSTVTVITGGKSQEYKLPFATTIHRYLTWKNENDGIHRSQP